MPSQTISTPMQLVFLVFARFSYSAFSCLNYSVYRLPEQLTLSAWGRQCIGFSNFNNMNQRIRCASHFVHVPTDKHCTDRVRCRCRANCVQYVKCAVIVVDSIRPYYYYIKFANNKVIECFSLDCMENISLCSLKNVERRRVNFTSVANACNKKRSRRNRCHCFSLATDVGQCLLSKRNSWCWQLMPGIDVSRGLLTQETRYDI